MGYSIGGEKGRDRHFLTYPRKGGVNLRHLEKTFNGHEQNAVHGQRGRQSLSVEGRGGDGRKLKGWAAENTEGGGSRCLEKSCMFFYSLKGG